MREWVALCVLLAVSLAGAAKARALDAGPGISSGLARALRAAGADLGNPVLIRVFKRPQAEFDENSSVADSFDPHPAVMPKPDMYSYLNAGTGLGDDQWEKSHGQLTKFSRHVGEMQLWIRSSSTGEYVLLKTYRVAAYSGPLGPKRKQGDYQTPEGFYSITPERMNPESRYIRAMDIGYPNAYDRAHAAPGIRLGGEVEIHGRRITAGCMAMGDHILDIYALVEAAQRIGGQKSVPVEIFPFPLTNANLAKIPDSRLKDFWKQLQPGYEAFERSHLPPTIGFNARGDYVVSDALPDMPNDRVLDEDEGSGRCGHP